MKNGDNYKLGIINKIFIFKQFFTRRRNNYSSLKRISLFIAFVAFIALYYIIGKFSLNLAYVYRIESRD